MPHGPQMKIVAAALVLVALGTAGCSRDGQGVEIGHRLDNGQVHEPPKNSDPPPSAAAATHDNHLPNPSASEPPAADATAGQVRIDNFTFTPQTLTIPVGSTVTWVNRDDVPHSVTSTEKRFNSGLLDTDEKFSFTFPAAGEFPYFCGIHPHMQGTIIVK
jgi:plastocyanin